MLILNHPRSLSVKVDTSGFCLFVTRVQEFSVSEITLKRVFSGHQYLGVRIFLFIISRQKQNIHGGYTTISICTSRHLLDQRTVKLPMIITNTQNYGVLAQRFAIESLAKSEIECDHTWSHVSDHTETFIDMFFIACVILDSLILELD